MARLADPFHIDFEVDRNEQSRDVPTMKMHEYLRSLPIEIDDNADVHGEILAVIADILEDRDRTGWSLEEEFLSRYNPDRE